MAKTKKKTLLVLEDGQKLTRAIGPAFEKAGYEVITYKDATGILVMAKQIDADLLVMDGQLRGAGAVSAMNSFARNANTAAIPVLAIVGRTGAKEKDLKEAGVRAFMKDPPDAEKLVNIAEKHELDELDF